ncbi:MAG TPA: hypothetical protein VFY85_03175 [Gemmatimonadaceae bacterium]|nr:hypothetical protein [Gemmatimonadaceae bacterium]
MMQNHDAHPVAQTDTTPARNGNGRKGFALPMAILVIAFLTITIAAAYSATSAERTTNDAQRTESKAYMIAQAGLENFMARRNEPGFCKVCGLPPAVKYESTYVPLKTGIAYVVAQRVRAGDLNKPAIYLLRSRGVDTSSFSIKGGDKKAASQQNQRAERTVAQLVYWNVNQVNVLSGWTATNGLDKMGSSGTVSGIDNNTNTGLDPNCPLQHDTVAGIAVPDGDYSATGKWTPVGDPPVKLLGNQDETNAAVKIDWSGIINGNRIQPDYLFPSGAAATAGWPVSVFSSGAYPVVRVNGDFSLPSSGGQGTLIVMGNLSISGSNKWRGIILVGGQMTSNGDGTVLGATMSGLNTMFNSAQLDSAQKIASNTLTNHPASATANGTKTYQYDSCQVAKAAGGLASYSVYPNAWMDNFVTY